MYKDNINKVFRLVLPIIIVLLLGCEKEKIDLKVLFLGNSLTFFHDVPGTLKSIALLGGLNIKVDSYSPGGSGITTKKHNPEAEEKFNSDRWDYIILQGQSSEHENFLTNNYYGYMLQDYKNIINRYRANGAKIILYMTWNINTEVKSCGGNCLPYVCGDCYNYTYTCKEVSSNYTGLGRETKTYVAPAGLAFEKAYLLAGFNGRNSLLFEYNDYHQSRYGTYLVASTIYSTITDKSSANYDLKAMGYRNDELQVLNKIKHVPWEVYSKYKKDNEGSDIKFN